MVFSYLTKDYPYFLKFMSVILPNLDNYTSYSPTKNCYLDGRYFNKVFENYPGLVKNPLVIRLDQNGYSAHMHACHVPTDCNSLIRVVIETPETCHSSLLILDHETGIGYWFEAFTSPYDEFIHAILGKYTGYKIYHLDDRAPNVRTPKCDASGFCTAYTIKYAYDYLNDQPSDLKNIRSFAARVEDEYPALRGDPDIAYGWLDNPRTRNAIIGALGGGLGGSLLGGGTGALIGAGLGGLGGYALSGPGGLF